MKFSYFVVSLVVIMFLGSCTHVHPPKDKNKKVNKKNKDKKQVAKKKNVPKITPKKGRLNTLKDRLRVTPLIPRWSYRISKEGVRNLYILEDILLVETRQDQVYALNRDIGTPLWIYSVGEKIDFHPTVYKEKIYFLSLGNLHVISKKAGALILKRGLSFVPSSGVCATDRYLFIGAWDKFVYAVEPDTGFHDWRYRLDGHVRAQPVTLDGTLFFPATNDNVFAISAQSGETLKTWGVEGRYATLQSNVAKMEALVNPPVIYIASRDYNLYSLNRVTGVLNWKFESGGPITKEPYVIGNSIYLVSNRETINDHVFYSVDGQTGREKWSIEHGSQFYFQGKYHTWVLLNNKKAAAVKPESGEVSNYYDLRAFDLFASNLSDNLGYVGYMATLDGYVFSVEEK